jgi:copper chaperone NosL
MYIWLYKLSGEVEIINGLNHYIGMAHIKEEMFPEFKILPYIVAGYIVFGLLTALLRSRKMLVGYLVLLILAGVAALYDFWQWGYEYGHNLSDDAAIKVPGMSYQPPLIGYKELLNFGAYSIPASGGWVFITVGILVMLLVAYEFYFLEKKKGAHATTMAVVAVLGMASFSFGCGSDGPKPIRYGKDACTHCKMTILDKRFATELVSDKGKAFTFDDLSCAIEYLKASQTNPATLKFMVINDYNRPGELIDLKTAVFLNSPELRSPMRGDMAAFSDRKAAEAGKSKLAEAKLMTWEEIYASF